MMKHSILLQDIFYDRQMIQQAVQDYKSLADIEVTLSHSMCICNIKKCHLAVTPEQVEREFANYVIGLTIKKRGLMKE